jgi:hypothetical protein
MMKTIETTATVSSEGTLTARVPPDIPPGEHRVVLVIEEQLRPVEPRPSLDFPVDDWGTWPESLSLSREDMYGDWGR